MPDAGAPILAEDADPWVVSNDFYDSAGGTISNAEAVKATATIPIPAHWLTYNLRAEATFRTTGNPSGNRVITSQLRLGTTTGGASGGVTAHGHGTAAPNNTPNASLGGRWLGESATGTRSVVLTMVHATAAVTDVSWDDIFIELTATRLT